MAGGEGSRNIRIEKRDLELLRCLFECRVMTRAQAAILHFEGKPEAAKKRLQLIKGAGYIADRPRLPHEPAVLTLTRKGFQLLKERGELARYPQMTWERTDKRLRVSPLTIQHEVDVMEFRAAFVAAVRRQPNLSIADFCTWPVMLAFDACQPDGQMVNVRPDGFIRLREVDPDGRQYEYFFFLEVDRSNESQQRLVNHIRCYQDYYRRGGFAMRWGESAEDFKSYPFRVLATFHSAERRNNFAERFLETSDRISSQVWMTTISEAIGDPVGSVWITASDYQRATSGIAFAPYTRVAPLKNYRRNGEREKLIEERICKRRLFTSGQRSPSAGIHRACYP